MKSRHKGRPSEVWTIEQRRKLSALMKRKHAAKMGELAEPKPRPELTPDEIAEIEADERERQKAAADFANELRLLTCERRPVDPAAEALFRRCGIDDTERMRELATWVYYACNDPDTTDLLRRDDDER